MASPIKPSTRILILGGGFAGINAVMSLEKIFSGNSAVEILLVCQENFFLFTPMLSEVAIGAVDPRHIVTPIRDACHKTQFHRAEVLNIDLEHRRVEVRYNKVEGCEDTLTYDHLVLALGSTSNVMLVPGVDRFAYNFKDIGDALLLRNHILEMFERADTTKDAAQKRALLSFCIIGGGYSGVEIAAAIQEMALRIQPLYPTIDREDIRVIVIEAQDHLLATLPRDLADYAQKQLEEMGIELRLNTRAQEIHATYMEIQTGIQIPSYTVVWATGIVIPALLMGLPAAKDAKGRPLGTSELRLSGYDNVWAIGDNVLTPMYDKAGFYPATAQIAVQQGAHVAKNIARVLKGKLPIPFDYRQKGEMVVLGERSAVALVFGHKIKGFPAWLLWRTYYLSQLPRGKKKIRVAMDWILNLFGPMETTQLSVSPRQEPCEINDTDVHPEKIPEESKATL